jgi:hypothetical protein
VPVLLSLNIFVKPELTTKVNRHFEIRDDIYDHLKIGSGVTFYDFQGGVTNALVQNMKVRDIVTDSPIPNNDYHQYNLTVQLDWLQKW